MSNSSAVNACQTLRSYVLVLISLLGLLAWSSRPAQAQVDQGSFVGFVTDPSGAIIPGAKVVATNVGTGVVTTTTTNREGYFEFALLPVGKYTIGVEMTGFRQTVTEAMDLHAGTKPRVDMKLQIGEVSQKVEVTAAAPLINATTTDMGSVIDSAKVSDLPLNGRDFTQLFSLENGYNPNGGQSARGGVEINGAASSGNNFLMDGVDMAFGDVGGIGIGAIGGSGTLINSISVDAIEEFKSSAGAFDAEYGHASGAVINVTTKSGTNTFHGAGWEYLRNNYLDATPFFTNASATAANPHPKQPKLRQNQFGGNLGGPIIKDKLFFFFNYEGARVERGSHITGNVPTGALLNEITNPSMLANLQLMPSDPRFLTATTNPLVAKFAEDEVITDREDTTLTRIDYNLGKNHISYRMALNKQDLNQPQIEPGYVREFPIPYRNITASDTILLSPNKTMEIRWGWDHWPIARQIHSTDPSQNFSVYGAEQSKVTTAINTTGLTRTFLFNVLNAISPSNSFVDNFAWVKGAHTIKAGGTIEHTSSTRYQVEPIIYYYNSIQNMVNDAADDLQLTIGNPGKGYNFTDSGFYAQDEWKINRRLQLNYGLRYDYYTTYKGPYGFATSNPFGPRVTPGQAIWDPNPADFGPRVGLVFDPTGSGKTVVRSGFSESFNPPEPYWYWDAPFISPNLSAFPYVPAADLPAGVAPVHFGVWNFQNFTQAVINNPTQIPSGLLLGWNIPERHHPDERVFNWNLNVQHAFTNDMSLTVSYVGNRDIHQFGDVVLNLPVVPLVPNAPNQGPETLLTTGANSWYEALELTFNKRFSHGYSVDAFFTWCKTMQYGNADGTNEVDNTTQDFRNIRGSIGPKEGTIPKRFTLTHRLDVPTLPTSFAKDNAFGRAVFKGWTLDGIMNWYSGPAINIVMGTDVVGTGLGSAERPDRISGASQYNHSAGPTVWLSRGAYDMTGPTNQARFGNLGYDTAYGPNNFTWDVGIHKSFPIHERLKATFRLEMFNWLNHPTFSTPDPTLADSTFGQITSAAADASREIQLAIRLDF